MTEGLLSEMQRSLEFFAATSGSDKISNVVLCGGCSALSGLTDRMQDRLGIPVELADPFRKIATNPSNMPQDYLQEIAPFMGVSIGLAIREVGD